MFSGWAKLAKQDRVYVVRNALRFPPFGLVLLYAYVQLRNVDADLHPWVSIVGGIGCLMGALVYALRPALLGQPAAFKLADLHFYLAAAAAIGVLVGLSQASSDPSGSWTRLRSISGWALCATAVFPIIARFFSPAPAPPASQTPAQKPDDAPEEP